MAGTLSCAFFSRSKPRQVTKNVEMHRIIVIYVRMSKKATASAQKVPHSRGLEFRMYNERTRQPELSRSGAMRPQRCRYDSPTRDIPIPELMEEQQGQRNCDGTLRDDGSSHSRSDCSSGRCGGFGLEAHPLAMVYSPCQAWRDAYTPDVALSRGTLFAELDLPFEPSNRKRGCM